MNSKVKLLFAAIVFITTSSTAVFASSVLPKSGFYTVATDGMPLIQKFLTGQAFPLKDKSCAAQQILSNSYFQSLTMMGLKIQSVYFSYQDFGGAFSVRITPLYDLKEYQSGLRLRAKSFRDSRLLKRSP